MTMNTEGPVFSVVIPSYNRSRTIRPTLLSVRNQTFRNFECLIIDDGSADSEELADVVSSLDDPRFLYVRQENGGASSARNRGFDMAQGRFIALLDSDDFFVPTKLEECNRIIGSISEDVLLYSKMIVERGLEKKWIRPSRGAQPGERVDEYILCTPGTIRTSTIVISTPLARRVRFDESLPWFQDSDFAIRASNAGARLIFVDEPLIVLEDKVGYTRVSRSPVYKPVLEYFDRMHSEGSISTRAYWAGRGWPCARVASGSNRPYAIWLYAQAAVRRIFPWRHALVVGAQVAMPYRIYQAIANIVVRIRGRRVA